MPTQQDIPFDFEGSLRLARALWSLADELTEAAARRAESRAMALADWTGPHADHFSAARAPDEDAGVDNVDAGLRTEAVAWGVAWARAVGDQNRVAWARAVERERGDRSVAERLGDFFVGDDSASAVPEPEVVTMPQPPAFRPTAPHNT